jgi:hypothetical protein
MVAKYLPMLPKNGVERYRILRKRRKKLNTRSKVSG